MRVPVDPYADGVLITSFESDKPGEIEASIEEGYVNIRKLPFMPSPLGLKFQVGRFRPAFGKFNTLHTHDLPQSTRSLLTEEFLGDEGFISQGVSTDFFIPTPWSEKRIPECEGAGSDRRRCEHLARIESSAGIPGQPAMVQNHCGHKQHRSWMVELLASRHIDNSDRKNALPRFHVSMETISTGRVEVLPARGEAMFSDPVVSPSNTSVVRRPKGNQHFSPNGNWIVESM
jgi:hypothetical protein